MTNKKQLRWLIYLLPLLLVVVGMVLSMLPVTAAVVNGSISIACGSSSAVGNFQADQYSSGGSTYRNSNTVDVSQITSNPPTAALFNNERYGVMSYTIPGFTAASSYAVTLYFAETYLTASGRRLFNVSINGTTVLSNFDIYASAGGQNKAIARSFTTTANSSGQIVIQFTSGTENPKINGISIQPNGTDPTPTQRTNTPTPTVLNPTPTPTPTPTPGSSSISIASGSSAAVGSFQADQYYSGGSTYNNSNTIDVSQITSNPPPAALFNNERYGAFSYTIPGFTSGSSYAVTLYFVETYLTASGRRIFNVSINGTTALSNFDIYASAGGQNKAIARSFTTTANSSGQIVIQFTSGTENPKINGISINAGTAPPTPTAGPTPTATPTPTAGPTPTQGTIQIPSYSSLPTISKLPDPFKLMNGSRITSKSEWSTRKAEISALAQAFEYGTKPPVPSNVTGSYSNNSITVNVTENGKSISFNCSITYPSSGTRPYPAIIGCGGSSLNSSAITQLGVAIINFPNDDIAAQQNTGSRGQGKFYNIYGSGHSAGALIAWAWGVDCLITALEKTPAANINASKLGVTGCSRNGKGALACGAFNDRIALVLPQEPGAGGAASWRISDYSKSNGTNVQTLSQIVTENCWFTNSFSQFGSTATKLPFDQHSIMGLCAPRGLLVIENTVDWLSPYSAWNSANAAHMIYEALGVPNNMGFSQYAHTSSHCSFQAAQQAEVTAFIQKFLLGNSSANTTCMKNAGYTFESSRWIDWTVPSLN